MELKDRIKEVRKEAGLTQEKFGACIGIGKTAVTYYENGNRIPSDTARKLICEKFNVNETWLLTGDGSMHAALDPEDEMAQIAASLYGMDPNGWAVKTIRKITRLAEVLTEEELETLAKVAELLAESE